MKEDSADMTGGGSSSSKNRRSSRNYTPAPADYTPVDGCDVIMSCM